MIKNINFKFFKSLKWKALKMVKNKKILLVTLASIAMLSGCVSKNYEQPKNPYNYNVNGYYQKVENKPDTNNSNNKDDFTPKPIVQTKLDEEMLKTLKTETSLNIASLNQFISNIKGIKVEYQYSELFGSDLALQKYNSLKEHESSATKYVVNGKINKSLIRETVLRNNKEFLKNYVGTKYKELDLAMFETVFNIFIDGLEYIVSNDTDLGQLDEKIGDLKILYSSGTGTGEMTNDKTILGINLKIVDTYKAKKPDIDYIRTVVLHETNHFGQIHSEKERTLEGYARNLGILYRWNDLKVNPLDYTWYTEGSAELLMTDQYGSEIAPTVYEHNIRSLDSLTLSALLRSDVDELTLAKLSYQTDLNELFKRFNCTNDEEKIEVINMMYAFDIALYQNKDFFNAYEEKYGKIIDNRYDYFSSLYSSIAQTLTKNFYTNLSTYLTSHKMTLEEIFSSISVFETEMNRLTKYTQSNYAEENNDFIKMYCDLQRQFFEIVAKSYGVSVNDIVTMYNAYYGDDISNVALSSALDQNELKYVNRIIQERSFNKAQTVNEIEASFKIR